MILWAKRTKASYQRSKVKAISISLNMLERWWSFASCEKREEISISRQTHHLKLAMMTSRMIKACQAFTAVIVIANPTVMIANCPRTKTKILWNFSKKASLLQMDKHRRSSHQSSAETSASRKVHSSVKNHSTENKNKVSKKNRNLRIGFV